MPIARILVLSLAAAASVPVVTFAQTAAPLAVVPFDPGTEALDWLCANKTLVAWLLTALIGHSGFSILSATLKKLGITKESPFMSVLIPLIRTLAVDVKPPPAVVVAEAVKAIATPQSPAQTEAIQTVLAAVPPLVSQALGGPKP